MLSRFYWNCSKLPVRKNVFDSISIEKVKPIALIQQRIIQTSCSKRSFCGGTNNMHNLRTPPLQLLQRSTSNHLLFFSTDSEQPLSNKEKLKKAVKEYGSTVIIFHVTISLMSLGICYLAVTSGVNMNGMLNQIGLQGSSEVATEAGLFVVAYAVHKVLAPVRIGITLTATPFIVRYLRKKNILKPIQPKN